MTVTVTALPTPAPSRSQDQDTFDAAVDALVGALPTMVTQTNAQNAENNTLNASVVANAAAAVVSQDAAAASATQAAASALSAAGAAGASVWVSGTTYAIGDVRYSPLNYLSYRRTTSGSGTTDPSADTTNWVRIVPDTSAMTTPKQTAMGVDLAASSTVGALSAADNSNLDVGTYNFTLALTLSVPDWTPSANAILLQKHDGTTGYILTLLTTGVLRMTMNATNYDSTVATGLTNGNTATIGVVVTRESAAAAGSVVFKVGENTLGASVAITAGDPATLDNASSLYVGGTSTTRIAAREHGALVFNRAITDSGWSLLVRNGAHFADIGAASAATYTADFSSGTDGFAAIGGTADGNIDAIGGLNDWLRLTINSSNIAHVLRKSSVFTARKSQLVRLTYYIPSTNSLVNGIVVRDNVGSSMHSYDITTTDAATIVNIEFTGLSGTGLDILAASGGATTFTGNGTDVIYVKVEVYRIGAIANYESSGIQPNQWHDSANDNHLSFPASGASLSRWKETGQYNWTVPITADTTLTSIVPAGYELEKILFKNATAGAVSVRLGTTAGGTEVFGLTALNTSATFGGFKTISVNQGFSQTAAQTLYLSSTDWTGGGTPPSLTFTAYFRRIS